MLSAGGFIQLLVIIFIAWFGIFSIVDRICKCVEHCSDIKYGAEGIKNLIINNKKENDFSNT